MKDYSRIIYYLEHWPGVGIEGPNEINYHSAFDIMHEAAEALKEVRRSQGACQDCQWGPNGSKQCEYYRMPESMRGECCQYWDLFRRFAKENSCDKEKL